MNKNIFEGTKFGDKFITNDNEITIYQRKNVDDDGITEYHTLITPTRTNYCHNKHEVIDNTIRLLEKMHVLPIFKVYYKLSVDNELYENHIMKREDNNRFYDMNGKRFDNETIESIRQQDIKTFRNSRGYNPNGQSEILYSQLVKLEDIGYVLIWNIMNYKTEFGEFKKFCFDMDEKTIDDFYKN